MAVRKWFVRCFVVGILLIAGTGYYIFERWTNPQIVRELILNQLTKHFVETEVRLASAEVKLFGGISLFDLRFGRKASTTEESFAVFPEVVVYPDKEKLTQGQLELHKVHLKRPKLHLTRLSNGKWNLSQLFSNQEQASMHWPIVEVRSGTITFIDEKYKAPPIHFDEVRLDLMPESQTHGRITMEGRTSVAGIIRLKGMMNLSTGELEANVELPEVVLKPELFERIALYYPQWKTWQVDLTGRVRLAGAAAYHPGAAQPLSFNCHGQFVQGRVQHPLWPFPIEDIQAAFRVAGGKLEVHQFTARMQEGTGSGSGSVHVDGSMHLKAELDHVLVNASIYDKLPPILSQLAKEFKPHGMLSAQGEIHWQNNYLSLNYIAKPQGMSILYDDLPYPFTNVRGTLAYSEPPTGPVMQANITAEASGQPVRLTGQLFGIGLRPDSPCKAGFQLTLQGENVPIDPKLYQGLEPYPDTLTWVKKFNLQGKVACLAQLERPAGTEPEIRPPLKKTIRVSGSDLAFQFVDFPLPCHQGSGVLVIQNDGAWQLEQFQAKHGEGVIQVVGKAVPTTLGDHLKLYIEASGLPLDEELKNAMPRAVQDGWEHFNPVGAIDSEVNLEVVLGKTQPQLDVIVRPRKCSIKPVCFPYLLDQVEGIIHFKDQSITVKKLIGRHGPTIVRVDEGIVHLREANSFRAELLPLAVEQLHYDRDLAQALPLSLKSALQTLQPDRPFNLVANVIIDEPGKGRPTQYGWNGQVELNQCRLHTGIELEEVTGKLALRGTHDGEKVQAWGKLDWSEVRIKGQPIQSVQSDLTILGDRIWLHQLRGYFHDGLCTGYIEADTGSKPSFQLHIRANRIDMQSLARQSLNRRGKVQGRLDGEIRLSGSGQSLRGLQGQGWVKVEQGAHLYDLPLILDLLNYLSRHLPKGSSFQDVTAEYKIEGDRIILNHLALMSDAITLQGKGEVKMDGSDLNLEMYGVPYGRTLPLLPPIIDRIPPTLSKQLMKIRIKGQVSKVEILTEPLPVVVDPVVDMLRMMTDRSNGKENRPNKP